MVNVEKYSSMAQVALVKRQWDHRYFCSNILFFKSLDAKGSNLHFCPASAMIMPSQMVFLHFRGGLDEHNGQEPRHHDLCRFVNRQGGHNGLANRWQGSLIIACFFRSLPTQNAEFSYTKVQDVVANSRGAPQSELASAILSTSPFLYTKGLVYSVL